ncbi:MAG: hypothetical protein KDD38_06355 [Bdellovibrionales bacterium]|nr:hypothetical protein [Bdellovibrionales bacterium]
MLVMIAISFIWSFAEGICFFIVPDVVISYYSTNGVRSALYSTLAVVVGSIAAAILINIALGYNFEFWSESLKTLWANLPGFYPSMLEVAKGHLSEGQARGLLTGPTSGIPYRFYVLEAFIQNIPLGELLIWTPLARLQRIIIAPVVVLGLRFGLDRLSLRFPKMGIDYRRRILLVLITAYWILTYIWYWFYFLPQTYGAHL